MYDELVKRLRQLAEEQMFDFERQPYLQAADAIEELSKDRDKWKATAQEERDAWSVERAFTETVRRAL